MKLAEIESPMFTSFTIGADTTKIFRDSARKTKVVTVDVKMETKKSVYISIQSGQSRYACNYESEYSKKSNLKFLERNEMNYLLGNTYDHSYFKLLNKQGKPELLSHIESLVEEAMIKFGLEDLLDELTVQLILPKELKTS